MKRQQDKRTRELGRIHILAKQLGLDREDYEAVIWTIGRQHSSKDLDEHGRRQVIDHLEAHLRGRRKALAGPEPRGIERRPLLRKIAAQLAAAGRDWHYALAMAQRMYQKQALDFCTDQELSGLVAALWADAKRHAGGESA